MLDERFAMHFSVSRDALTPLVWDQIVKTAASADYNTRTFSRICCVPRSVRRTECGTGCKFWSLRTGRYAVAPVDRFWGSGLDCEPVDDALQLVA